MLEKHYYYYHTHSFVNGIDSFFSSSMSRPELPGRKRKCFEYFVVLFCNVISKTSFTLQMLTEEEGTLNIKTKMNSA